VKIKKSCRNHSAGLFVLLKQKGKGRGETGEKLMGKSKLSPLLNQLSGR